MHIANLKNTSKGVNSKDFIQALDIENLIRTIVIICRVNFVNNWFIGHLKKNCFVKMSLLSKIFKTVCTMYSCDIYIRQGQF